MGLSVTSYARLGVLFYFTVAFTMAWRLGDDVLKHLRHVYL